MQSGFADIFPSEKSSLSIQCEEVFLSVVCMHYAGKEVIEPFGHLVSLTATEVGNGVIELSHLLLGELKPLVTDSLKVKIMLVEKA